MVFDFKINISLYNTNEN